MAHEWLLSRTIAIGLKAPSDTEFGGEGLNLHVQVGFSLQDAGEVGRFCAWMGAILKRVDHAFLGLDVDLGAAPDLPQLALWLAREFNQVGGERLRRIHLRSEDGRSVSYIRQSR